VWFAGRGRGFTGLLEFAGPTAMCAMFCVVRLWELVRGRDVRPEEKWRASKGSTGR